MLQSLECVTCGLNCDDPARRVDTAGQRQSVGANIGSDVDNRASRWNNCPKGAARARFKRAEEKNRKVDAFAKIELPHQAATPAQHNRPSTAKSPAHHDDALNASRQSDLRSRRQWHRVSAGRDTSRRVGNRRRRTYVDIILQITTMGQRSRSEPAHERRALR